jgi:asparagine synthase (glutamine-hydrolysing)
VRRLTTGPVPLCGAVGDVTAAPSRKVSVVDHQDAAVLGRRCGPDEIVLGQRFEPSGAPRSSERTVLSGRIELPTGGTPAAGPGALTELEAFLDRQGVDALASCRGEFCLAHADRNGSTLYLYRSLTTVRGLYHRRRGDRLMFSTDPEDLCDPRRRLRDQLDRDVLAALAIEAPLPDDTSWYAGVRRLPAGHLLVVDRREVRIDRHDDLRVAEPARLPFPAAATAFRELCSNAVARAVEDVPTVGIQLSGGLDSAVVAFEASRHGQSRLHPFHFHYDLPGMADERAMAEVVARDCRLDLTVIDDTASLGPGADYLVSALPQRAPLTHGYVRAYLSSSEHLGAQPGPRRLLSGVGGDELLAPDFLTPARTLGWRSLNPLRAGAAPWQLLDNHVIHQLLGRPLDDAAPAGRWSRLRWHGRVLRGRVPIRTSSVEATSLTDGIPWFMPEAMDAARAVGTAAVRHRADGFEAAGAGLERRWQETFTTYELFHRHINDYHMAAWQTVVFDDTGIEYVPPLFDRDLVEFCLRLTTRYRETVHRGQQVSKALMRAAYAGHLPRALLARLDKVDYGPVNETLVINNKELFRNLLGPGSQLAELDLVAPPLVSEVLDEPTWQLRRVASELVNTASVELWLRGCDRLPHEPIPTIDLPAAQSRTATPPAMAAQTSGDEPPGPEPEAGSWRPGASTVIRFLADEAVLLDEEQFTLYRLNRASADLLSRALRCGTWPRLEAELRRSDTSTTDDDVRRARSFVTSLCRAGLLTGRAARTLLEHDAAVPSSG